MTIIAMLIKYTWLQHLLLISEHSDEVWLNKVVNGNIHLFSNQQTKNGGLKQSLSCLAEPYRVLCRSAHQIKASGIARGMHRVHLHHLLSAGRHTNDEP